MGSGPIRAWLQSGGVCLLLLSLTGCASDGGEQPPIDYGEIKILSSLIVPPDLDSPNEASSTDIALLSSLSASPQDTQEERILPFNRQTMRFMRDGGLRWLEIDQSAESAWDATLEFWPTIGLTLEVEERNRGIMETGWAVNRADVPADGVTRFLRNIAPSLYDAGLRDKYRLRIEPTARDRCEIYISHYGMQEIESETSSPDLVPDLRWQPRPADIELANEVLNLLALHLSSEEEAEQVAEVAQERERAQLEETQLTLLETFPRAWRRVGMALDRIGIGVSDRDRSQGLYFLQEAELPDFVEAEEQSWFSRLFSEEQAQQPLDLRLRLSAVGEATQITVINEGSERPATRIAEPLLQHLYEQLR